MTPETTEGNMCETNAARDRALKLVRGMTLREKAALCSGRGYWHTKALKRLGLASVMLADGPHGLRRQGPLGSAFGVGGSAPATCFPTASLTACSFDRELVREIGEAIAEEAADQGVAVVLGPGVNIKRSPLGGRNFEYFSEDPYLSGELGAAFTRGVQGVGVGACVKHFAANSQETNRMVSDSVMDEATLREVYLPAFEKVVKDASPAAVMCSYNKLNGTYASENRYLLTDILRGEWGYEGMVVSDWGAAADRVAGLEAGLDLEMPGAGGYSTRAIVRAVKSGRLPEDILDRSAARVAELAVEYSGIRARKRGAGAAGACVEDSLLRAGPGAADGAAAPDMYARHHAIARRAAAESVTLLKNEGGALPLAPGAKIAVIGEFARTPRYQGSGSSRVNPTLIDRAWDELLRDFPDAVFAPGYRLGRRAPASTSPEGRSLADEAVRAARAAEIAVVFAGLPEECESEGFDRESLSMPAGHEELIRAVCAANPKTVVVVQAGAPVDLAPAQGAAAILYAYLGGQAGGGAVADVLAGRTNPSGRLAETFPLRIEDTPCHGNFAAMDARAVVYDERALVGYRHYESLGLPSAYPFGYGLSYTTFRHSDRTETDLGGGARRVSVTVTNTGGRAGAETVLFYDEPDAAAGQGAPRRALRGFEKVFLEPGESATVSAEFAKRGRDCGPDGSNNIVSRAAAQGEEALLSLRETPSPARFDANSTLSDVRRTPLGLICYLAVRLAVTLALGTDEAGRRMANAIVDETPLRALSSMSGGLFPRPVARALAALANLPRQNRTEEKA